MNLLDKLSTALAIAAVLACVAIGALHYANHRKRAAEVARLEKALVDCGRRERDAADAIARQNAAIEAVRVDTVVVERLVKEAATKYAEVRKEILHSVERDSGCENQINNIDYALRRFHGVELRAEDGNKD